jgi:recombination protein RecR
MIVEKETDLLSVEETGKFQGIYCVLGHIPKTGNLKDWQKLRLSVLKKYIQETLGGVAQEIILGFNPSSAGDIHTQLIQKELQGYAKKISRLGRGLPTGAEIEFADSDTLGASLDGRK